MECMCAQTRLWFMLSSKRVYGELSQNPCYLQGKKFLNTLPTELFWPPSIKRFHTCHGYRRHLLLLCYTTFSGLDLGWGSQGQRKAEPLNFIFSYAFQLNRMKSGVVINELKINILVPDGYNCCFTILKKKSCLLNLFRFGITRETTKLYINFDSSLGDLDLD